MSQVQPAELTPELVAILTSVDTPTICSALEIPHGIEVITARERPLIEASRRPGFSVANLKAAMQEAEDIH